MILSGSQFWARLGRRDGAGEDAERGASALSGTTGKMSRSAQLWIADQS